jgi:glycosyltransferase involved in cell wall biosynthesis
LRNPPKCSFTGSRTPTPTPRFSCKVWDRFSPVPGHTVRSMAVRRTEEIRKDLSARFANFDVKMDVSGLWPAGGSGSREGELRRHPSAALFPISPGHPCPQSASKNRASPRGSKLKRILYAGAISPHRGLHILLEAFKTVVEKYPNVHLDLVGPQLSLVKGKFFPGSPNRASYKSCLEEMPAKGGPPPAVDRALLSGRNFRASVYLQ